MVGLGWLVSGLWGCADPAVLPVPRLDPVVDEASGLVVSSRWPGIWWAHNDSGDSPRLFAVRPDGSVVREVPVQGAQAVDWEDLTLDLRNTLWIADLGNNSNHRQDLTIYALPEPDPSGTEPAVVSRTLRVRFLDQEAFPDPAKMNFDAEALFTDGGRLFVLSKHRSDTFTTLYEVPLEQGDDVYLLPLGTFDVGGDPANYGGMVTAADLHPSGRYLAVLTYHALWVFERPDDGRSWLSKPVHSVKLDQELADQCEGVAWDGWSVVFVNEDRRIFRVDDPFHRAQWP